MPAYQTPSSVADASPQAMARRSSAFRTRLERAGHVIDDETVDDLAPAVSRASDRTTVLAAAGVVGDLLSTQGINCSKSQALEAIAAYHGERSWAAMDAALRKASGSKDAHVEEREEVLGDLVVRAPGGDPSFQEYFHPDDCRQSARRISVRLDATLQAGIVRVFEGLGNTARILAEATFASGGRKAAGWSANILALDWMGHCPMSDDEASRSERMASLALTRSGFAPVHTGGGVFLWQMLENGKTCSVVTEDGEDPLRILDDAPVLLLIETDDTGYETSVLMPTLNAALEAVQAEIGMPDTGIVRTVR